MEMLTHWGPVTLMCQLTVLLRVLIMACCLFGANCLNKCTGDPLHSRAACTQPCNVKTHSRAHCSPGARLCEQWGHGCVNNGSRLCASARLCRGSPVKCWPIAKWTLGTNIIEIWIKIHFLFRKCISKMTSAAKLAAILSHAFIQCDLVMAYGNRDPGQQRLR